MTWTSRYFTKRGTGMVGIYEGQRRVGYLPIGVFRTIMEGDPASFDISETPDVIEVDEQVARLRRLLEEPAIRMVFDRMEQDALRAVQEPSNGRTIRDIQDAEMRDLMRLRVMVTLRRRCEHLARWRPDAPLPEDES